MYHPVFHSNNVNSSNGSKLQIIAKNKTTSAITTNCLPTNYMGIMFPLDILYYNVIIYLHIE